MIVSTYNKPEWLEKVLWGYPGQEYRDFELLIADDGSGEDTRDLILGFARGAFPDSTSLACGRRVQAVHHPQRRHPGLHGDYLVFSDGDCIPRRDFVGTHVEFAEPGRFSPEVRSTSPWK